MSIGRTIPVPLEELTEPVHIVIGIREFACGHKDGGVAVYPGDKRATCTECKDTIDDNR